jgi:hypothetical protein
MSQFVPVPYVVQLDAIYSQAGQFVENSHFYQHGTTEPTMDDMSDLCADYVAWYVAYYAPLLPAQVSLVKLRCFSLSTQNSQGVEYATALPITGSLANGVTLPNNVTYAVSWRTGLRGRSFRGRTYAIGLAKGHVLESSIHPSAMPDIAMAWHHFRSMAGEGWTFVVVSRFSGGGPRSIGVATPVYTFSIDPNLDSQRRRLPGRGS